MKKRDKPIAVTMGDPAGVGPETILKAFHKLSKTDRNRLLLFGDIGYFRKLDRKLKTGVTVMALERADSGADCLRVEPVTPINFRFAEFGKIDKRFGTVAMESVVKAMTAVMEGRCACMVTAPINKGSVNLAGFKVAGHTEFLAQKSGAKDVVMMLTSKKLSVALVTTHLALKDVAKRLSNRKIEKTILLVDQFMNSYRKEPGRIAVTGLNPHAGDGSLFGSEEEQLIAPAIESARRKCLSELSGPHPADTMFTPQSRKKYDVAIAMYHDQGLIPVKALGFGETINVTIGLPFLRVSVDHGTAFDIAGENLAEPAPMVHAIKTARQMLQGKW